MVFSSILFLFLFLPICFILYHNPFIKNITFKNIILLIFSIIFYCYGAFSYLYVLIISIIFNYIIGILISKLKYKKIVLSIGIIINISMFLYYKITGTISSYDTASFLPIIGPLGISFFTFQELSYIIDIYRKIILPQKNFLKYSLYVTFFPQLIAGPIVRYDDVHNEIDNRKTTFDDIKSGFIQITIGLFKKCVIADNLGKVAMAIVLGKITSLCSSWLGAILLMIQFYYDFSGYSNMAIGLGKIFGFNIKENFSYPYAAKSINEFWKKWNISLGTWFNDYLLFPICNSKVYKKVLSGLSKKYNKKTVYNFCNFIALLICWIVVGLWHGIAINYLYLGLYYFVFIYLEKKYHFFKKSKIFSHIYVLLIVCIGTVLFFSFRDPSFKFLRSLFYNKTFIDNRFILYIKNYFVYIILGILFSFPLVKKIENKFSKFKLYDIFYSIVIFIIFSISIYYLVINNYSPFLYFNF